LARPSAVKIVLSRSEVRAQALSWRTGRLAAADIELNVAAFFERVASMTLTTL
jgi:hypothetical protein